MTQASSRSDQARSYDARSRPWLAKARDPLAGAGAGAVAAFLMSPLDVIRTRLMVQKNGPDGASKYRGIMGSARTILREEGVRGFYKGLMPQLYALGPNWAVYFGCYSEAKGFAKRMGYKEGPLVHMLASMVAAIATDVATNPIWLVKTRLQTQILQDTSQTRYTGVFNAFKTITREEGFFSLWNGLTPQLIGAIHVMIQFPLYERLKLILAEKGGKTTDSLSPPQIVLASSISKTVASLIAYPHEVLRSRMQAERSSSRKYHRLKDVARSLWQNEGMRGFYRGLGTNLVRTVPTSAITLTSYELFQRILKAYE